MVSEAQLAGLPSAAQRYLRFMEVPGRPAVWSFLAHITGRFRLRPGLPWLRCAAWQCRLISRSRSARPRGGARLAAAAMSPVTLMMTRGMLLGIKQRAESGGFRPLRTGRGRGESVRKGEMFWRRS